MILTKYENQIMGTLRIAVLAVSVALIVMMSVDVFAHGLDFPFTGLYMKCQLPVCMLFLCDFFAGLFYARKRGRYIARNIFFFLISIPYSWILQHMGIHPTAGAMAYVIHFVPTLRATLALAIVIGFVSKNPLIGLFASYASIVLLTVFFSSLVFYIHEGSGVNPGVTSYWSALWWSCLQATTLGASFYAVTTVGKAIAMLLSMMGMLMFPLFTVYVTQIVKKYLTKMQPEATENS